ncbi:MAG: MHYT domain-containing protein [Steroidobacteraceae bacterium]
MHATYNLWLVSLSILVAIAVSYTALMLAGRVAEAERSGGRIWLLGGAASMGIGIWSMHFIGMLAYSVPIQLRYNVLITLASLLIAMLTSGFALSLSSRRDLKLPRLAIGSIVMGAGICAMHYTGMAAIQIVPAIGWDPVLVAASVLIAVTASFAALWLFFRLRGVRAGLLGVVRASAAVVMGCAIAGMHYTAMFAAMLGPSAYCYGGAAFDNNWLAVMIAMVAVAVITITLITLVYDAHLESRSRRDALRLATLNEDLKHGKNLLTLATQAAGIACWEYELSPGRILWTENEIASLGLAGLDPRRNLDELFASVHPEDATAARAAMLRAVRERRETCAFRLRMAGAEGATIHLQMHARLLRNDRGRVSRLLGVSWDVSEQVRQEERRLRLQLQLQEASREAGMAEVATGVLHSIGNVLNSLSVSASILSSRLRESRVINVQRAARLLTDQSPGFGAFFESDPRGREFPAYLRQLGEHLATENRELCDEARAVATHVEHIGKIVAAQQTYARHGGSIEELEVSELIEHAIALHFPTDSELLVRRDYQSVGRAVLDRHKVLQILANLLSNARHAMRGPGQGPKLLTVRLHPASSGSCQIEVEDTGTGISEESMRRLFEFGFTTKEDGHGFGLHSSAILAREMGGELIARSDGVARGACFTLRLPLAGAEAELQRRSA